MGCIGRGCLAPTGGINGPLMPPDGGEPARCVGRSCSAPTGRTVPLTTIFPTEPTGTWHASQSTGTPPPVPTGPDSPAQIYHAAELTGNDQDTLPIIVEDNSNEPFTLLADIDLSLTENYISSGILAALELVKSSRVVDIPKKNQRVAALGNPAFEVTSHARITLDLLTGPDNGLKQFADVEFNVFDLPVPAKGENTTWKAEVFLGMKFLRDAGALRLTDAFGGHGAVTGLPVLVRRMDGDELGSDQKEMVDDEARAKDEL